MNYTKHDFGLIKSVALNPNDVTPRQPAKWFIPYGAIGPIALLSDALIICFMGMVCGAAYHVEILGRAGDITQYGAFAAVVAGLFVIVAKSDDLYTLSSLVNLQLQIRQTITIWVGVFLFLTGIAFALKAGSDFSRGATISFALFGLITLVGSRIAWRIFLVKGLAARRFSGRKVVLITEQSSVSDISLSNHLARHGLQPIQHFMLPAKKNNAKSRKEVISRAIASVRGSNIEEIVISANPNHWSELKILLSAFRVLPFSVRFIPTGPVSELLKLSLYAIGDTLSIELQRPPRTSSEQFIKGALDVFAAATSLILLLPLLLVVAVAIKLESPGPVIFRQWRCGFNGIRFQILKFRTMSVMEDGDTVLAASRDDPRVTRIGNWLRRTSIDELPQLINVLRGDMSIIGPRPHAVAHDNEFDKLVSNYAYRQHVKPGLTGWAQVNGYRGTMRTVADIKRRIEFDLWYIDNWSFALDFKIMFRTFFELTRGQDSY